MNEFQKYLTFPGQPESIQSFIGSCSKLMSLGSNTAAVVSEAVGSYISAETQERINKLNAEQSLEGSGLV